MSKGIKNLKEVIVLGLDVYVAIDATLEDKKLSIGDYVNFLPVVKDIPAAVAGIGEVLPELKDLDSEEQQEIMQLVMEKLPSAKAEWAFYAEHAIKIGLSLWALLSKKLLGKTDTSINQ